MNKSPTIQPGLMAGLVGSRLCHDLVNPLGAIGNGVELLELTDMPARPELDLIRDAVFDMQARLKYYRIAFGETDGGQVIRVKMAQDILADMYKNSRITPYLSANGDFDRQSLKLGFLMMLCAESALPMGGQLRLSARDHMHWTLEATAPRVRHEESLWSVLRHGVICDDAELHARDIQFFALYDLANACNQSINFTLDAGALTMSCQ
jgi:histidine phosphotransferase ChpT